MQSVSKSVSQSGRQAVIYSVSQSSSEISTGIKPVD